MAEDRRRWPISAFPGLRRERYGLGGILAARVIQLGQKLGMSESVAARAVPAAALCDEACQRSLFGGLRCSEGRKRPVGTAQCTGNTIGRLVRGCGARQRARHGEAAAQAAAEWRRAPFRPLQGAMIYGTMCKRNGGSGWCSLGFKSSRGVVQKSRRRSSTAAHGRSRGRSRCSGPPSLLIRREGAQTSCEQGLGISGTRRLATERNRAGGTTY